MKEPSEPLPEPERESAQDLTASEYSPSESDGEDRSGGQGGFVVGVEASFRGPLPPPAMLNDYNAVLPGLADRIVQMAEKEQSQSHRMQRWYAILRFTGQGAAFVTALAGLVIGGLLINGGHHVEGLVALVAGLVPVVSAFLYRQIKGNGV